MSLKKLIIILVLVLVPILVLGVDQEVRVDVLAVPTMFLGNESGADSTQTDTGMVFATLGNNGADVCQINWGTGFVDIAPTETSASNTYFTLGNKIVRYRCKGAGQGDVLYQEVTDNINILKTPPLITINTPINNSFLSSNKVLIDLIVNERVVDLDYTIDGGRDRRLCKNCGEYNKTKRFGEGLHVLMIKANDRDLPIAEETRVFTVDSKEPKIKKSYPKKRGYGDGTFTVEYEEDFLQVMRLYYGNNTDMRGTARTDCPYDPGEKTQICEFNVDVSDFEGKKIMYNFEAEDNTFATIQKNVTRIMIDTTDPVFNRLNFTIDKRRVEFDVMLSEEVLLEYKDLEASRPRFRRLCSNCDSYDRKKSFSKGNHTLIMKATDKAENFAEQNINFTIV